MTHNTGERERESSTVITYRLSKEVYEKLEKEVSRIYVGKDTTPYEVAFQLGIQYVLKLIREGITVSP